mgnify:CR=1 FL=1
MQNARGQRCEGVVDFRVHARADATTAGPIQSFQACLQHR